MILSIAGEWADYIVNSRSGIAARSFTMVETSDAQVAVVYLRWSLGACDRSFQPRSVLEGSGERDVRADRRAREPRGSCAPAAFARFVWGASPAVTFASVEEGKRGLLYLDGRLIRELGPGITGSGTRWYRLASR